MKVALFSTGVSSFCSVMLAEDVDHILYTHIDDQHEDSLRYLYDCERYLGRNIELLQSPYKTVANVVKAFSFISSPHGAKCTDVLKRRVRKEWEASVHEPITYVWGYDLTEKHRADRVAESMQGYNHDFPLIKRYMTKADCHGMLAKTGIKRPYMYDMGYSNNNCIGCVKGGMGYWNKIRRDFPETFRQRVELEREVGHSCINGVFLDELDPESGRNVVEIMPECGIACEISWMAEGGGGGREHSLD